MHLGPPLRYQHLDRRGGAQVSGGLWRRAGGTWAAKSGAWVSVLVFLFRQCYRDPGRLNRPQSRLMPTNVFDGTLRWFDPAVSKSAVRVLVGFRSWTPLRGDL